MEHNYYRKMVIFNDFLLIIGFCLVNYFHYFYIPCIFLFVILVAFNCIIYKDLKPSIRKIIVSSWWCFAFIFSFYLIIVLSLHYFWFTDRNQTISLFYIIFCLVILFIINHPDLFNKKLNDSSHLYIGLKLIVIILLSFSFYFFIYIDEQKIQDKKYFSVYFEKDSIIKPSCKRGIVKLKETLFCWDKSLLLEAKDLNKLSDKNIFKNLDFSILEFNYSNNHNLFKLNVNYELKDSYNVDDIKRSINELAQYTNIEKS